jgi:glycosyltransferase involved in cell wall biosynthesis
MKGAVSAVIPVHDGERFVADAIRSVLGQTRPPNECIVVDDGSTDDTADVVAGFGREVTLVRQVQLGVSAARNTGIRAATGDLIAFLDADDVWLPQKLAQQVPAMASCEVGASYTGYAIADADLRWRRLIDRPTPADEIDRLLALEVVSVGLSFTGVVRRDVLERIGGFNERLSTSADLDLVARLARRSTIVAVPEVLSVYRQHGRGQLHRDPERLHRDMVRVLDEALAAGMARGQARRALANVLVHVGGRLVVSGSLRRGLSLLTEASSVSPSRVVLQPAGIVTRRARQTARARVTRARSARVRPSVGLVVTPPR